MPGWASFTFLMKIVVKTVTLIRACFQAVGSEAEVRVVRLRDGQEDGAHSAPTNVASGSQGGWPVGMVPGFFPGAEKFSISRLSALQLC